MPMLQLNISVEKGCEGKLGKLLEAQDNVSNLRVGGESRKIVNVDVLGKINRHYKKLYSLYLENCSFSN
jgi:hypothetical protein